MGKVETYTFEQNLMKTQIMMQISRKCVWERYFTKYKHKFNCTYASWTLFIKKYIACQVLGETKYLLKIVQFVSITVKLKKVQVRTNVSLL